MSNWACRADAAAAARGVRMILLLASTAVVFGCVAANRAVEREDAVTVAESMGDAPTPVTTPDATPPPPESVSVVSTILAPRPEVAEGLQVRGITVARQGGTSRLVVDLSQAPETVKDFRLDGPPRVVLDLRGPHRGAQIIDRFPTENPLVQSVRVGHYDGRMRLVVDLTAHAAVPYRVERAGTTVTIELSEAGAAHATPAADDTDAARAGARDPATAEFAEEAIDPTSAAAEAPATSAAVGVDEDVTEQAGMTAEAEAMASGEKDIAPAAAAPAPQPRLAKLTGLPGAPKAFTGKRISLDFKDADVQNVLRVIADVSGLNVVATDDVTGRITLHLVDVPWDQALDVVLQSARLKMMRDGDVVRISTVERVREEQEELQAQQIAEKELESLQVRYIRVNYARADKALTEKVQGVLTDRGSSSFDERTNTIIVRDIARGLDTAVELIRNIDIQSPQVLIEANIVEAVANFAQALGVQWGYRHLAGPQTGNPTGMDFPGTVDLGGGGLGLGRPPPPAAAGAPQPLVPLIADFPVPANFGPGFGPGAGSALDLALGSISGQDTLSARITALEEEGKGRIVSRPRVITMNNIPARIESLTILRVRLPSTGTVVNTGTGGVAGTASTATEKIETGIILTVVPQVSSDGFILLNITVKSSQADFSRTVDQIPTEISRQANSNVLIRDGETVVLGGIFRNEADDRETGMPYLRRIPGIGWLFKRMLRQDRKDEMLVFITPQVVAGYGADLPTAKELWENRLGG
jgi:type IV pilus assembly protein PilQ